MSETSEASPYMTTAELAKLLRMKPQAIRDMRYKGTAPKGTKVGRAVLFHIDDVQAWLDAKTQNDPVRQRAA